MPTLEDIARAAEVSPATVSRVLNQRGKGVRPKAARRAAYIRQLARDMGYLSGSETADAPERSVAHGGFIMRDVSTSACDFEFVEGVSRRLVAAGVRMTIVTLHDLEQQRRELFKEKAFDFLIVRNVPARWRREVEAMAQRCVWLDTNEWRPANCLRRDEFQAGRLAAAKLIEAGYEQIVFVGAGLDEEPHFNFIERRAGAEQAAAEAGVPLVFLAVQYGQVDQALADDFVRLLSVRTGVLATDATLAKWCAFRGMPSGVLPGRDYGLACCSEEGQVRYTWPELSRVSYDRQALGEMAAEMQLDMLADPRLECPSRKICGEWIEGSTARVPGKESE